MDQSPVDILVEALKELIDTIQTVDPGVYTCAIEEAEEAIKEATKTK